MGIPELGATVRPTAPSPPAQAVQRVSTPSAAVPATEAQPLTKPEPAPNLEQVQQAVKAVAATAQSRASNLQFSIDKDTGTTVVKVVDAETQDVIRQIPSEELLAIARSLDKVAGLLLKQKA